MVNFLAKSETLFTLSESEPWLKIFIEHPGGHPTLSRICHYQINKRNAHGAMVWCSTMCQHNTLVHSHFPIPYCWGRSIFLFRTVVGDDAFWGDRGWVLGVGGQVIRGYEGMLICKGSPPELAVEGRQSSSAQEVRTWASLWRAICDK